MAMSFAHYPNILFTLASLGYTGQISKIIPGYNSALVFELYNQTINKSQFPSGWSIKVRYFEGHSKTNIYTNIRSKVSEYLMNITRRDRLPKSDLIAIIEGVDGVDSVNIRFVSESEETARKNGYYVSKTVTVTPSTPTLETIGNGKQKFVFFKRTVVETQVNFEPNAALPESVIGLDSFGDIILGKEDVAMFRGGWLDRDGIKVPDDARIGEMAALSVYFDEPPVPMTIYSSIQTQNRKQI
jgi:hypothetical protein